MLSAATGHKLSENWKKPYCQFPLQDQELHVCCAVYNFGSIVPIIFHDTVNSEWNVNRILEPIFEELALIENNFV
jgi:hypothetical protein